MSDISVCGYVRRINNHFSNVLPKKHYDSKEYLIAILHGQEHASLCNKLIKRSLYIDNEIAFVEGSSGVWTWRKNVLCCRAGSC